MTDLVSSKVRPWDPKIVDFDELEALDLFTYSITTMCPSYLYAYHLDPVEREVCLRIFENRGWDLLPGLIVETATPSKKPKDPTLEDAIKLTLSDPEVRKSPNRERHIYAFAHLRDHFGDDRRVSEIWVPEIKGYIDFRQSEGAKGSTIGKEKAALSLMFKILIEHRILSDNPVSMVTGP